MIRPTKACNALYNKEEKHNVGILYIFIVFINHSVLNV